MKLEILSIGNEVLYGDIVNTNAAWLSERLTREGFEVVRHVTIADDEEKIAETLREAASHVEVVVVTGGLGPTVDDFTLEIAAKVFGKPLEPHPEVLEELKKYYTLQNRALTPNQEKQAMIPQGAQIFLNPVGSAPGVRFEFQGVQYFFMPGVPKEMKEIFEASVLPWLLKHRSEKVFYRSKILRCFGAEEAKLDHLLQPLLKDRVHLGDCKIAFRFSFPEILVKVSTESTSLEVAERQLEQALEPIRKAIGHYIFTEEEKTLERVVGELLLEKKLTLGVAESCTGGLVANRITNVPGASNYFLGGIVAYSNELKTKFLGVSEESLKTYGAVSSQVAIEMAQGVRSRLGADIGISVTGIAGPTGGTEEKPVGTVHIGLATKEEVKEKKFYFPLDRERFKLLASSVALNWVRRYLLSHP
jgi:nicotinamide-nucleotide amidase